MNKEGFVVDNNIYVLAKDKDNNNVTNVEIHDIVFKIILEIDRICRVNDISYALSFGSALGLYKYGDFVPWDDDADIVIDYFDYHRLVEALKKDLSDDFDFECFETDDRYNVLIPPIKVRYKKSYIKEKNDVLLPDRTRGSRGLFVDICTFMGVPKEVKKHKNLFWRAKWSLIPFLSLETFLHINLKGLKKSLKKYEESIAKKYKDSDYVSQTVIIPFQEFPLKMVHALSFPKEVIYPFKEYDFRGHKIYSFNNIEEFSRLRYGESALKVFDGTKYIDTYQRKDRKSEHLLRVDIYK